VVLVIVFSFFFNAWSTNWTFTMIAAIAGILFVETFAYYFVHHPRAWQVVRWLFILLLLCLMLIGSIG
jgi:phosphatidylserine synthase